MSSTPKGQRAPEGHRAQEGQRSPEGQRAPEGHNENDLSLISSFHHAPSSGYMYASYIIVFCSSLWREKIRDFATRTFKIEAIIKILIQESLRKKVNPRAISKFPMLYQISSLKWVQIYLFVCITLFSPGKGSIVLLCVLLLHPRQDHLNLQGD